MGLRLRSNGAIAVGTGGLDLPDDVNTMIAAETLFKYVTGTFVPDVEAAFKDVEADLYPAPAPVPALSLSDVIPD